MRKLPPPVDNVAKLLKKDLERLGPILKEWPNFNKIKAKTNCYHCHLKRGKPTYVAVWKIIGEKTLEVTYVGSHEKADYNRLC